MDGMVQISGRSGWLTRYIIGATVLFTVVDSSYAQVISDDTLPNPSRVELRRNRIEITEGTQADRNLFHSFREFSVPRNTTASFQNIDPSVENIFSRVTGSSISRIDGRIRILDQNGDISSANFLFINPNGVIFGRNASLRTNGSFLTTTAESIQFKDGTLFSAVNPQQDSLLTVSIPVGLQFGNNPEPIVNRSFSRAPSDSVGPPFSSDDRYVGLQLSPGQTLALVGGDIQFLSSDATVPNGRIELGSVGDSEYVQLLSLDNGWRLGYRGVEDFGNIRLINFADVDTSGEGGGTIRLRGDRIFMGFAFIRADTLGDQPGNSISIRADELIVDEGEIYANTYAAGDGGDINIDVAELIVRGGGQIYANTFAVGDGGNIRINASQSIRLTDVFRVDGEVRTDSNGFSFPSGVFARVDENSSGNAGNISIFTERLRILDGAQISADTNGLGSGGDIVIRASDIALVDAARSANGDFLMVDNNNQDVLASPSSLSTFTVNQIGLPNNRNNEATQIQEPISDRSGNSGNIIIESDRLSLRDGGTIQSNTLGAGDAGDVVIRVNESVEIFGIPTNIDTVGIFTFSGGIPGLFPGSRRATGQSGSISIETRSLTVQDAAVLASGSIYHGPNIVQIENQQSAGSIRISAEDIELQNGVLITASTLGQRNAGNIRLTENNLLSVVNSSITATADSAGGGEISIRGGEIYLQGNSDISAFVQGGDGNPGNISIHANVLFAFDDSDILASSETNGGNLDFAISSLFTEDVLTPSSSLRLQTLDGNNRTDIFATGVVTGVLPFSEVNGLTRLPYQRIDTDTLLAESCITRTANGSIFLITGSGGLPDRPGELPISQYPTEAIRAIPIESEPNDSIWQPGDPIEEPQGLYQLSDGRLILSQECD